MGSWQQSHVVHSSEIEAQHVIDWVSLTFYQRIWCLCVHSWRSCSSEIECMTSQNLHHHSMDLLLQKMRRRIMVCLFVLLIYSSMSSSVSSVTNQLSSLDYSAMYSSYICPSYLRFWGHQWLVEAKPHFMFLGSLDLIVSNYRKLNLDYFEPDIWDFKHLMSRLQDFLSICRDQRYQIWLWFLEVPNILNPYFSQYFYSTLLSVPDQYYWYLR